MNFSTENIAGFVTVRASSSRLPGKCLLPFGEGNVLNHMIRRARSYGIEPIICTSNDASDDVIEKIAIDDSARFFRGSLVNKLKRWSDCAAHFGLKFFHTLDADDPFFDGEEIRRSMILLRQEGIDMVCPTDSSSAGGASVGYSLTFDLVKRASIMFPEKTDTEMVWRFLEKVPGLRGITLPEERIVEHNLRLTLDYKEDYWLLESLRRIVGNLASRKEIDQFFQRNPDFCKINLFRNVEWKAGQFTNK